MQDENSYKTKTDVICHKAEGSVFVFLAMIEMEKQPEIFDSPPDRENEWTNPVLVAVNFSEDLSRRLGIMKKNLVVDRERFCHLLQGSLVVTSSMWDIEGNPVTPWRVAIESLKAEGKISIKLKKIEEFSSDQLQLVEQEIVEIGEERLMDVLDQERILFLASRLKLAGEPMSVFSRVLTMKAADILSRSETKIEKLSRLFRNNPNLKKTVASASTATIALLLVSASIQERVIASSPLVNKESSSTYIVKPGDTLWRIAEKNGTSLGSIILSNPQISNPNLIFPDQEIVIPSKGSNEVSSQDDNSRSYSKDVGGDVVLRGPMLETWMQGGGDGGGLGLPREELWVNEVGGIVFKDKKGNVENRTVIRCDYGWMIWNPLDQKVERILRESGGSEDSTEDKNQKEEIYIVRRGDTLLKIAEMFGVRIEDVAQINNIKNVDYITIGQRIKIPNYLFGIGGPSPEDVLVEISYPVTIVTIGNTGWSATEAEIIAENLENIVPKLEVLLGIDSSVVPKWIEMKIQKNFEAGGYSMTTINPQGEESRTIGLFDASDFGYLVHEWTEAHVSGRVPNRAWQDGLAEYARVKLGGNWTHTVLYKDENVNSLRGKSSNFTENTRLYTLAGQAWFEIENRVKSEIGDEKFISKFVRSLLIKQNNLGVRLSIEEALLIADSIAPGARQIIEDQNILF